MPAIHKLQPPHLFPNEHIQNTEKNMSSENIFTVRKMLKFRAWHRGTREMDLLMGSFADKHIDKLAWADLLTFYEILLHQDPDVYDWILGRKVAPAELHSNVLTLLLNHQFTEPVTTT